MLTIHVNSWMEEYSYPQSWQKHTMEISYKEDEDLGEKIQILLCVVLYDSEI